LTSWASCRPHQQCNREWPCDRCQRRKIADECRYNTTNPPPVPPASSDVRDRDKDKDDTLPHGKQGPAAPVPNGVADGGSSAAGSHPHASWFDTLTAARVFSTLGLEPPVRLPPDPICACMCDGLPQAAQRWSGQARNSPTRGPSFGLQFHVLGRSIDARPPRRMPCANATVTLSPSLPRARRKKTRRPPTLRLKLSAS